MTLDDILDMWDQDSQINEDKLDRESVTTAKLHSKYLRLLIQHKTKIAALAADYNTTRQAKFRYYRGEMSREELKERQWDQWQGIKPLKNEMDEFLTGDSDLNRIDIKISYLKVVVEAVEAILKQIAARDWQVRNAIEFKKFIAGA